MNNLKKWIWSSLLTTLSVFLLPENIVAQEFKHEIGGALGTSFYLGDANKTKFFLHPGITGGAVYRYNINFHWAVKANLLAGTVSGNTQDSGNKFLFDGQTSFKRTFADAGAQVEFNFLPYSDKYAYAGTNPFTPYIFAGAGTTLATGNTVFFNANVPLGAGFKYKVKNRLNVGIEFSVRKLFGDDFDVTEENTGWDLNSPYGIESGFLKNRDWYSLTMIFLTWDFGLRNDPCCN